MVEGHKKHSCEFVFYLWIQIFGTIFKTADERNVPAKFHAQSKEFIMNEKLVCLGGQLIELVNNNYRIFHKYPTSHLETSSMLKRFTSLPHPGVMFLKSAVQNVGGYQDNFKWVEDWDLWLRLLNQGEIYNLEIPTVIYRRHVDQVTQMHKLEIAENGIELLKFNIFRIYNL